ncbi:carbohydrate-binding protein [Catellatospora vulcania]|uniref:hypothetical protein n=1 Tax=Catellatospora vulcania TaxID=1460450 RepID=UPI0012D456F3|nr:hypothetical protein [Catellatospora vulcania]
MPVVSARVLGWSALILAVGATIAVVPPLVMPGPGQNPPSLAEQPHGSPTPQPSAAPTARPPSPAAPSRPPSPTVPGRPAASAPPKATTSAAARFQPITVHAADPANLRVGARVIECPTCVNGSRVGYIGGPNTLAVQIKGVPQAGERTLTVVYETEQPRTLKLAVDGGPARELALAGAQSWLIPVRVSVRLWLPKGACWIRFFNDTGSAPDINMITVS